MYVFLEITCKLFRILIIYCCICLGYNQYRVFLVVN